MHTYPRNSPEGHYSEAKAGFSSVTTAAIIVFCILYKTVPDVEAWPESLGDLSFASGQVEHGDDVLVADGDGHGAGPLVLAVHHAGGGGRLDVQVDVVVVGLGT